MEKLGSVDILYQVSEAADELQDKIDRKSYLLVNAESWEIGNREKALADGHDLLNLDDDENKVLNCKSYSEAVLDLRSLTIPKSWDGKTTNIDENSKLAPSVLSEDKSKTYESASALSLATFSSLLIEFVARLQNVVDSFEELSQKANFKDPSEQPTPIVC